MTGSVPCDLCREKDAKFLCEACPTSFCADCRKKFHDDNPLFKKHETSIKMHPSLMRCLNCDVHRAGLDGAVGPISCADCSEKFSLITDRDIQRRAERKQRRLRMKRYVRNMVSSIREEMDRLQTKEKTLSDTLMQALACSDPTEQIRCLATSGVSLSCSTSSSSTEDLKDLEIELPYESLVVGESCGDGRGNLGGSYQGCIESRYSTSANCALVFKLKEGHALMMSIGLNVMRGSRNFRPREVEIDCWPEMPTDDQLKDLTKQPAPFTSTRHTIVWDDKTKPEDSQFTCSATLPPSLFPTHEIAALRLRVITSDNRGLSSSNTYQTNCGHFHLDTPIRLMGIRT